MVWIILSWTLSPKLLLELFIYVEDDWANRAIREGLIRPEDKIPLVQMRIRTAVARSIIINRAEISHIGSGFGNSVFSPSPFDHFLPNEA
jgi:hypothetical protein